MVYHVFVMCGFVFL